jgi:hypothetical protein
MMNQRIKELEPQCWEHNEFGLNFNYEKFAELIVRECAEIARSNTRVDSKLYLMIREHFGVEE